LAYYFLTSQNRESEPVSESSERSPVNRPNEKNNLPDQQEGELNQQSRNGSTNQLSQPKSEGQSTRENKELQPPDEALEKALGLIEAAKAGKAQGQPGAAVQKALAAWEILNQHPQDSECKALADQVKIEIQDLAKQANAQHKSEIRNDTKKLITN